MTLGRFVGRLLSSLSGAVLCATPVLAESKLEDGCDQATQEAVETIAEKYGFGAFEPASAIYSIMKAYLSAPDAQKYDELLKAIREEGAGLVIPGFDVVRAGGTIVVGGVEYTIQQAQAAQLDAFLCGGGDLLAEGFFKIGGAQAIVPGITCENFAEKITTIEQLNRFKVLFDGFYTNSVVEFGGRQNDERYREILRDEWSLLERTWKARTGARLYQNLLDDLVREAERAKARAACTPKADPAANPADAAGEPAGGGPRLELVRVGREVYPTVPEWIKSVDPGRITTDTPFGRYECRWNEPPQRFTRDDVFNLDLTVATTPKPGQRMSGVLQLRSGFVASIPAGSGAETYSEPGIGATNTRAVTLQAPTLDYMQAGDAILLMINGCEAGAITYVYEFRN